MALLDWKDPAASWRDQALCAEVSGGDLFFPDKGGSTKDAKRLCAACDVRSACLDFAVDNDERFGVWGGLSERERRGLARSNPLEHPTTPAQRPARERRPVGINHGTEAGRKAHLRLGDPMCVVCDTAVDPAPAPQPEPPRERPGVTRPWRDGELVEAVALLTGYGMTTADIAAELHVSAARVRTAARTLVGAA